MCSLKCDEVPAGLFLTVSDIWCGGTTSPSWKRPPQYFRPSDIWSDEEERHFSQVDNLRLEPSTGSFPSIGAIRWCNLLGGLWCKCLLCCMCVLKVAFSHSCSCSRHISKYSFNMTDIRKGLIGHFFSPPLGIPSSCHPLNAVNLANGPHCHGDVCFWQAN